MLRSSKLALPFTLVFFNLANAQGIGPSPSVALPPSGAAGGDLGGTYPNPTVINGSHITNASIPNSGLATPSPCSAFGVITGTCAQGGVIIGAGPIGSATTVPIITYNAAGQLTTVSSATIAPAASSITGGAALTKVDDTNVTLTLGGAPSTALLGATSISVGWTGTLANARLAPMATNTVKGNGTSGSASPTDLAVGTCSTAASALIWTTNTGFGCNTSITANSATSATNSVITDDNSTAATMNLTWATSNTGSLPLKTTSTKLTFIPSSGALSATSFTSSGATAAYLLFDRTSDATNLWLTYATGNSFRLYNVNDTTDWLTVTKATGTVNIFSTAVATSTTSASALKIGGGLSVAGATWTNTLAVPGIASDAATTDNTVCVSSTGLLLKGSGTLGICLGTSGAQFKTAFAPMAAGIDDLMKINFQNYRYRDGFGDSGVSMQYGATAQDVEKAIPDLVRHSDGGDAINYDSGALLFVGLHAIQQLKVDNDNLRECQASWKCRIFGIK